MRTKSDHLLIKSPRLRGDLVENILFLLNLKKELSVSELLSQIKRKLPLMSCKTIKKYLVYLADYELILYDGQRHVYRIEENGVDLLYFINKEKMSTVSYNEDITITIERGV